MGWDYQITNTKFINPYNFVPVEYKKKSTAVLPSAADKITGVINCSLYTRGPIAILDTEHKDVINEHSQYSFMKNVNGQYMIPASSIRGMIRSVHEVVTNSCFATVKEDSYITARSNSPYMPAILMKEKDSSGKAVWKLYKATRYMLKSQENTSPKQNYEAWECHTYFVKNEGNRKYIVDKQKNKIYTGEKVCMKPLRGAMKEIIFYKSQKGFECGRVAEWVEKWNEATSKRDDMLEGYLVIGEAFGKKKHHESVFHIDENQPKEWKKIGQDIINEAMEGLKAAHKVYNDEAINKQLKSQMWYGSFETMEKQGCIPIWCKQDNKKLYFSLACIGRMTYQNTLSDLVGKKTACTSRKNLCTTCSMFGMAGKDEAFGSRVRFLDAVCEKPLEEAKKITLKELSSPRPSYLPFYLKQKGRNMDRAALGYDNPNCELRGRKFYWHFENPRLKDFVVKSKLNATVEILGGNRSEHFKFKIYFDGMTVEEVATLVYSLNFNQNEENGSLCHKIGHGKPLGLGSVKLVVDDIWQRSYTLEKGYDLDDITNTVFKKVTEWAAKAEQDKSVKALKEMVTYDAVNGEDVRYPYIIAPEGVDPNDKKNINALASHKWFSKNYKMGAKYIDQTLPDAWDEDKTLNAYKAIQVEDKKKHR